MNNTDSNNSSLPKPPSIEDDKIEAEIDDFGYGDPIKEETPPAPAPKEEDKPIEKKVSGYDKKEETPPAPPATPPAPPAPPATPPKDGEVDYNETLKDLPESIDKEKVLKFATENKLSKEQVEAYKNFVKEETASIEARQNEAVKEQRSTWKKELMTDPEFGGENFDKNVDRVEKVLEKYMPNMKKVLTERGSMLPPYIMRDFLALDKLLNPSNTLVTGDVNQPKEEKNYLDELYQ